MPMLHMFPEPTRLSIPNCISIGSAIFGRPLGPTYATGPLSCLSVMLVYSGQTVAWINMLLKQS